METVFTNTGQRSRQDPPVSAGGRRGGPCRALRGDGTGAGGKRRPQVPVGSTAGGDGPSPHTGAAHESLRGGVCCAVGHGGSEGRPYLSLVPHIGTEDASRGDGGLIQRVPKRLPVSPIYREVLHVDRLLRGDRLHRHETGGRGSAQRGGLAFWGRGEPAAPTGVSTRGGNVFSI